MTHNTIDMATASKPDTADLPLTTESANEQASSRFYPNGYNYDDAIPSVIQFYTDVTNPMIGCISIALVLWLLIGLIYFRKINYILRSTPKQLVERTLLMNSAYPIVATASVASLLVPSAMVIGDSVCHLTFAMLGYQFFHLVLDYAGGKRKLIELTNKTDAFIMRTPPCFCCCVFLKPSPITLKKLSNVRLMVLQLPIVQCIIVVALNIVNMEQKSLYAAYLQYFAPVMICSILIGIWGLNITVRTVGPLLPDYHILGKLLAIQLVLILCKLQPTIIHQVVRGVEFEEPGFPLSPKVYANAAAQTLILFEMLLLALWASAMYRVPSKPPTNIIE